jgi:hypothetical protein
MIVRILGVIVGLFLAVTSALMMYIGQDGLIAQISMFMVGSLFAAYGLMGPRKMGKFLPATVKEIGGETLPNESRNTEK